MIPVLCSIEHFHIKIVSSDVESSLSYMKRLVTILDFLTDLMKLYCLFDLGFLGNVSLK